MKRKLFSISALTLLAVSGLAGCGGGGGGEDGEFDFNASIKTGSDTLFVGKINQILITEFNPEEGATYTYDASYSSPAFSGGSFTDFFTSTFIKDDQNKYFVITPKKATGGKAVTASIREKNSGKRHSLSFTIMDQPTEANAGFNYAANTEKRLEILGKLEKYAMENYLTGITLFENGGYIRYSDRVKVRATEYITGYGWGVLTEGKLEGRLTNVSPENEPDYLQSSTSSDPLSINGWNATGSQVSDLFSYISTSYWGTRMKGTTEYEWYPVLAKDKIIDQIEGSETYGQTINFERPMHVEKTNETGLYKTWRIYVKTDANTTGGLKYHTASTNKAAFNNRPVVLEDYEFIYQMLLTERSQLFRGAELAGDTTYGIKGGQAFFRKSKGVTDNAKLDALWKQMKDSGELGVQTGVDPVNGDYIQLELVNPIDEFTAMYTLSSNLYSPMPKAFIQNIGSGDYTKGASLFGTFPSTSSTIVMDYTLCLGAYHLKKWNMNVETIFARNDDWFEYTPGGARYQIPGVRIRVMTDITQNEAAVWQHFNNGELDSTNIPKDELKNVDLSKEKKSGGDSTFKLNVNSCTQEEWNRLFGTNGVIEKTTDNEYLCHEWMSNKNFLKGLYWSINREKFAKDRGVTPSYSYFAGSYMSDPENGVSYNSTQAHIDAVKNFHNLTRDPNNPGKYIDDYGYSKQTSIDAFKLAVNELVNSNAIKLGTKSNPTKLEIRIEWMYPTDERDYGKDIASDFKAAFEDDSVCGGRVVLDIKQHAGAQWDLVYNEHLMRGRFDLGFGAISGNSYNPLNFLEVLKSNNSSGFTLNWGTNTGLVDENNPIVFEGQSWSYDALWAAGDHGTVVTKGRDTSPVTNCYVDRYTANDLHTSGGKIFVPFTFTEVDKSTVEFNVDMNKDVQLYLSGAGTIRPGDKDEHGTVYFTVEEYEETSGKKGYKVVITPEGGAAINQLLVDANDLEKEAAKKTDEKEKFIILHPFTAENYNLLWNIEVHYTIKIGDGIPTENTAYVYRDISEQEADRK